MLLPRLLPVLVAFLGITTLACGRHAADTGNYYVTEEMVPLSGPERDTFTSPTDPGAMYAVHVTGVTGVSCWDNTGWPFGWQYWRDIDALYEEDGRNFTKPHGLLTASSALRLRAEDRATHSYDFVLAGTGDRVVFRLACPPGFPVPGGSGDRALSVELRRAWNKGPVDYVVIATHAAMQIVTPIVRVGVQFFVFAVQAVVGTVALVALCFFLFKLLPEWTRPSLEELAERDRQAALRPLRAARAREREAAAREAEAQAELRAAKEKATRFREARRAMMDDELEDVADLDAMRARFHAKFGAKRGEAEYKRWRTRWENAEASRGGAQ